MNKKKGFVVLSTTILVVALIAIAIAAIANNPQQTYAKPEESAVVTGSPPLPPIPITDIIAKQKVNSAQDASSMVGYNVNAPTNLPSDYKIQMISVEPEAKFVTMLASPLAINESTTHAEFFYKQKGILVYMEKKDTTQFDKNAWLKEWANDRNATMITIAASNPGAIHGILTGQRFGQSIQQPAEIVFFRGDTLVELRGMVSSLDLVRAAESMTQ